jgi:ElaB/YqjD/DUF883 family membrane-anchored ribosome-binding protein
MAKKSGQLTKADKADKLDTFAGDAERTDPFVERYADATSDLTTGNAGLETENLEMTGEHPDETEHLKAQIEETRSQMGETIDALQERLSLSNVSEQVSETVSNAIETAKDSIYDATIGKAVEFMKSAGDGISNSGVVRTVRNNPFPLLLIGVGAGLLAYQSFSGGRSRRSMGSGRYLSDRYDTEYGHSEGMNLGESGTSRTYAGKAYERVSDTASNAYQSVSGAVGNAYDGVSEKIGDVYSSATDAASRALDSAGHYKDKAYDTYDYYIDENPLAVGAVALAVGAAVGFAIPATRFEGRMMGEARENLLHKAQDMAGDLVNRAKHVAGEAGKTVQQEAKSLTQ